MDLTVLVIYRQGTGMPARFNGIPADRMPFPLTRDRYESRQYDNILILAGRTGCQTCHRRVAVRLELMEGSVFREEH